MGPDSFLAAARVAKHVGFEISSDQRDRLETYYGWLRSEAVAAGGIGPSELNRLWDRHIADSLTFYPALAGAESCLDIGSGVGLPGIPLAIVASTVSFTLLDRAGRRCDLMRRVIAVLGLTNCRVDQGDVASVVERYDAIVSRAAIPIERMMIHVKRLLGSPGTALLGVSRTEDAQIAVGSTTGMTVSPLRIPAEILDSGATLLRIEAP